MPSKCPLFILLFNIILIMFQNRGICTGFPRCHQYDLKKAILRDLKIAFSEFNLLYSNKQSMFEHAVHVPFVLTFFN